MSHRTISARPDPTSPMLRLCLVLAGLIGAAGVMAMALAAHVDTSGRLATAAEMMLFHAPVYLAIGVVCQARKVSFLPIVLVLMTAGLILFCGDLASRAFFDQRLFPMSAPTGGMLLISAWAALALSAIRIRPR